VIDIGAGDSRLVDHLISLGLDCIAVLDVSGAALQRARTRIGTNSDRVEWIEADVTADWSWKSADIWHDRAVFHFLTDPADRARYRAHLTRTLKPGGSAVIATFAPEGPEKCSGLPVVRYSPETLASELGGDFSLMESLSHEHQTPQGSKQAFQYSRFVFSKGTGR
jgi:SAM-dependent methyltransferase